VILIDNHSRVPIYQQVKEQIIMLINTGVYKPNDQLSSIRNLSKELDINVNTIKRAFAELESDGVVYSVQGKGVFVSENPLGNENIALSALKDVATAVTSAKAMGVTKEQVKNLVDNIYEAGESDD
jgi:GntR family transcriptional regulator